MLSAAMLILRELDEGCLEAAKREIEQRLGKEWG